MPITKEEEEAEWKKLFQKYKDSKANDLAQSVKKIKKEKDDFEKMWINAGQAVYDENGNLLPTCKKALKKKN
jgi:hypothetical protein